MARVGGSEWRGLYHSMMTELFCIYEKRMYIMGLIYFCAGAYDFAFLERRMHCSGVSFCASLNRC